MPGQGRTTVVMALAAVAVFAPALVAADAAEDLRLREGISFYQDIDSGFPILASRMDDVSPENGRPTLIFFGASGDLNTNRQSRRLVDLYKRYRNTAVKFVVIDVDHPASPEARQLIKEYYRGYIPFQILLDRSGQKSWGQIGEVEQKVMQDQINKLLD